MAKRFRDTKLSRQAWYRKLRPALKCAWDFLCDECDEAGVWSIDMEAMTFFVREEVDIEDLISEVNLDKVRLERFDDNKIFIPGFVEFQYGQLSENCKPHIKIISLLKKYNLFERVCIPYAKGIHTLQEKEEEKEEEMDTEERGSGGKQSRRPNLKSTEDKQTEVKAEYEGLLVELKKITDVKNQKLQLAEFISLKKPLFIEPFADLWNLSAQHTGVPQIDTISDGRLRKFKTRAREPAFNFLKILEEIRNSMYLQGKTKDWKADWDWIFENDTNYLKVQEGKYRNATN